MAEIFTIPVHDASVSHCGFDQTDCSLIRPDDVPDDLWYAVESVHHMDRVESIDYHELRVPASLADFGIGVELSCTPSSNLQSQNRRSANPEHPNIPQALAPTHRPSGWIMILYSSEPRLEWDSQWRCVAFFSTEIVIQEHDSLTSSMFLDEMMAHLTSVQTDSVRGTVTVSENQSFGVIEQEESCSCEIRVSWTPAGVESHGLEADLQVQMWAQYLRDMAF
ncbi:DUF3000 family protein [Bifidobacterium sp.]|jgi:hypothetical protein|uniref:DUF3000 family protein n=1 Tax=Bifidobacterium sp. TaxID=41200 RepID=UPI0025BEDC94|nr:DUF3000 family protein [Bifidobacterium sp.]MCI1635957.1 DUF3000 domain-containing protein [Bifidobacterium sp.]